MPKLYYVGGNRKMFTSQWGSNKSFVFMASLFLIVCLFYTLPVITSGESSGTVNLARGKSVNIETPYAHFDSFQGIGNYENESDVSEAWKLTNGNYGNTEEWNDFSEWFVFYRKQKRTVIVDLEDVNTVNSLSIGFGQNDDVGIVPPINVRYFVSNDGSDYRYLGKAEPDVPLYFSDATGDKMHRKEFELTELQDGTPLNVQARYVKFEFTIGTFGWADEIEINGQPGIVDNAELPESQPDDYEYGQFAEPGTAESAEITDQFVWYSGPMADDYYTDWTKDKVMSFLGYIGIDGDVHDWFFDDLLAIPVVAMLTPSGFDQNGDALYKTMEDMNTYLDFVFQDQTQFGAINEAAGELNEQLGTNKKVRINMAIPYITETSNFGDIVGDGSSLSLMPGDFTDEVSDADSPEGQQEMNRLALENKKRAVQWYIDEVEERFQAAGYENLKLNSFYWYAERLFEEKGDVQLIRATADYLQNKSYYFTWIPYLGLNQTYTWRDLGFTTGAIQPNFAFNNSKKAVFPAVSELAKKVGGSVEIEYDDYRTLTQYLNAGYTEGFMADSYNTYYLAAMPIAEGAYAFTPFDHDKHDEMAIVRRSVYDQIYEYTKGDYVPRYNMDLTADVKDTSDMSVQITLPLADAFVSGHFSVHYDPEMVQYNDFNLPEALAGKGTFNVYETTPGLLEIDFEMDDSNDAIFADLQEKRNPSLGAPELLTLKFAKQDDVDDDAINARSFVVDEMGEMVDKDGQVYLNFTASDILPDSLEQAISEAHQAVTKAQESDDETDKSFALELVQALPDNKVKTQMFEQLEAIVIVQTIKAVIDPSDITVDYGTNLADLDLPDTALITLTNGDVRDVPVTWNEGDPTFEGETPGTYAFTGTFELPDDLENPANLTTHMNVMVNKKHAADDDETPGTGHEDQVIIPGETVKVGPGNIVFVKGSESVIIMPDDLPKDSMIRVTLLDEDDLEPLNGHKLVGKGIAIDLQLPPDFKGDISPFVLEMAYDQETNTDDQVDLYNFNTDTDKWVKYDGKVSTTNGVISLEVDEFSIYALFAELNDETSNEDGDSNDQNDENRDKHSGGHNVDYGDGQDENGVKDQDGKTLPKTATFIYNWFLIGGFLVLIGVSLIIYKFRSQKTN